MPIFIFFCNWRWSTILIACCPLGPRPCIMFGPWCVSVALEDFAGEQVAVLALLTFAATARQIRRTLVVNVGILYIPAFLMINVFFCIRFYWFESWVMRDKRKMLRSAALPGTCRMDTTPTLAISSQKQGKGPAAWCVLLQTNDEEGILHVFPAMHNFFRVYSS